MKDLFPFEDRTIDDALIAAGVAPSKILAVSMAVKNAINPVINARVKALLDADSHSAKPPHNIE